MLAIKPLGASLKPNAVTVVLVVDDDPVSVQLLSLILNRSGFKVVDARSGEIGLEQVYQRPPDVVIVDDMMPGMSGGEMCRRIKDDPAISSIPVILISAGTRVQDEDYVRACGADAVLLKPALTHDVVGAINSCLEPRA